MPKKETALTDDEIIELYWDRNESAISETDKKYRSYLYTIANNILKDALDSEECLNDTYLGTWNAIPPTRPNFFQIFLSKLTRNIAVDRFRKNSAARRIPSEMTVALEELDECFVPSHENVEEEVQIRELVRVLNAYLKSLDEDRCFMFVSRYYYADPVQKIARMLGIGVSSAYRQLSEMRADIKRILLVEELKNEQ